MDSLHYIKAGLLSVTGILVSAAVQYLGGFDRFLQALIVCMTVDLITGWLLAAVFKASGKSKKGRLDSEAGFHGLLKKGCALLMIVVAVTLDSLMQTGGLTRDAVVVAFILNEIISILENMGLMGVKLPAPLINALEWLSREQAKRN